MVPKVDKLMVPYLIKVCYFAAFFAGMVQAGYQFGKLGGTSGHSGNIVVFGQALSRIIYADDKHEHCVEAFQRAMILWQYIAGNFAGGVWTNHDDRKSLRTAGMGLVCTGMIVCLAAFLTVMPNGLDELGGTGGHIQQLGSFAMGLQNGILVATTGYANTVTTTGTITDIGLLIGGLTAKRGDSEWVGKFLTLTSLVVFFIGGSFVGGVVFFAVKDRLGYIFGVVAAMSLPGAALIVLGLVALRHSHWVLSCGSGWSGPMIASGNRLQLPDVAVVPALRASRASPLMRHSSPPVDEAASDDTFTLPVRGDPDDAGASSLSLARADRPSLHGASSLSLAVAERQTSHQVEEAVHTVPPPAPSVRATPLVFASFFASFIAGMIDVASERILPKNPTPTHITGPTIKVGMGASALLMGGSTESKELFLTNLVLCNSFFVGNCVAGVIANTDARKSRRVGAYSLFVVGCVLIMGSLLGYLSADGRQKAFFEHNFAGELQHLCGLAMGFQNGILCAITGFARTTHMTGPMANFGICLGQASNPEKVTGALVFKLKANLVLFLLFIVGVVVENVTMEYFPGEARWVSVPAFGLVCLAGLELFFENKQKRARLMQGIFEEDEMEDLRDLACAGGFTDSIVNIRTVSAPEHSPSRSRFRNLQLAAVSFIEEESDDGVEPYAEPCAMYQAPMHHSINIPRRPEVPKDTMGMKRSKSAPGAMAKMEAPIPRAATLSWTRMPSLSQVELLQRQATT